MSLSLTPTLSQIRKSVMIRAGVGAPGSANAAIQLMVDEFINASQYELYYKAEWIRLSKSSTFNFIAGISDYNVPDDCDIGNIHRLYMENSLGSFYEPKFDFLVDFRNAYKTPSMPRFWQVQDGVIRFLPAPDATIWTICHLDYNVEITPLVNETDRPAVDGECLIQRAVIKIQAHLGIGRPTQESMQEHLDYLERLRVNQGPPQMFLTASRKIDGPAYWDRARSIPYTPDWNPPGDW